MRTSDIVKPSRLVAEKTVRDGNCGLNATTLAITDEELLGKIEDQLKNEGTNPDKEFRDFIDQASMALGTEAKWSAVKAEMLELKKTDKVTLQKELAQTMRKIAMSGAENDADYLERTKEPLISAFRNQVSKSLNIQTSGVADDIFARHAFIKAKFQELAGRAHFADIEEYNRLKANGTNNKRLNDLEKELDTILNPLIEELVDWWGKHSVSSSTETTQPKNGHDLFIESMKLNGQWVGDLELARLAKYFHVNLDVSRPDFDRPHHMYINHGALPAKIDDVELQKQEIHQLYVRGIIDKPQRNAQDFQLLPLDKAQVEKRLSAVPQIEKVLEFIERADFSSGKPQIPDSWSRECREQLVQRSVIGVSDGIYSMSVDKEEAKLRIAERENKNEIVKAWDVHHKDLPTITLTNPSGLHWENMVPVSTQVLAAVKPSILDDIGQTIINNIQKNKIKPSRKKWELFVENKINSENSVAQVEKTVNYTVSDTIGIKKVTVKTQIELDKEFSKRLQQAEYAGYISKNDQERLDKEMAIRLQEEENRLNSPVIRRR